MSSSSVLPLYREMLREASRFQSYIYRTYALRRVKDAFHENKNITDSGKVEQLLKDARKNLDMMKRQATLNNMYQDKKLVIENWTRKLTIRCVLNKDDYFIQSNTCSVKIKYCKLNYWFFVIYSLGNAKLWIVDAEVMGRMPAFGIIFMDMVRVMLLFPLSPLPSSQK